MPFSKRPLPLQAAHSKETGHPPERHECVDRSNYSRDDKRLRSELGVSRVEAHCLQSGAPAYDFDSHTGAKRFP